jgi:hypothetical protein
MGLDSRYQPLNTRDCRPLPPGIPPVRSDVVASRAAIVRACTCAYEAASCSCVPLTAGGAAAYRRLGILGAQMEPVRWAPAMTRCGVVRTNAEGQGRL